MANDLEMNIMMFEEGLKEFRTITHLLRYLITKVLSDKKVQNLDRIKVLLKI